MLGRDSSIILDLATWPTDYIYNLVSRSRRGAYDAWISSIIQFSIECYGYRVKNRFLTFIEEFKHVNELNRDICSRRKFEMIL